MKDFKVNQLLELILKRKEAAASILSSVFKGEDYSVENSIKIQEEIDRIVEELKEMEATLNTYIVSDRPSIKNTLMSFDYLKDTPLIKPERPEIESFKAISIDNTQEV